VTAPVWMASPPEVHSTLLSSGPGPGPLLSAAASWSSLSVEYASVADELTALLGAVQGGAWEGPTAAQYVAAHLPYLAWLTQASANSATAAAQHETTAAAYSTALAAMPTLPELAANHAIHGALVATNFFGINTIPIALNEADYVRMWTQAAATMATYDALSGAAVASTPQTTPVPQIIQADDVDNHDTAGTGDHDHEQEDPTQLDYVVADLLRRITGGRIDWDPLEGTLNGVPMDDYTDATQPMWWVARSLEFSQQFQTFGRELFTDPASAFQYLVQLAEFDWPTHVAQIVQAIGASPQLLAVAMSGVVANLGAVTGVAGLAGLAGIQPAALPAAAAAPTAAPPPIVAPTAGSAPVVTASATATAPAPPSPSTATVASAPAAPPAATGVAGFPPYLIGGGPGIGFGSGMSARAKAAEPAPDTAGAAAAQAAQAAARAQARARRRRGTAVGERGRRDEYMDLNCGPVIPPPDDGAVASNQGAGPVGFAGTTRGEPAAQAAGLTALADDEFGGGPRVPMLPGTWHPNGSGETGRRAPSA
jgi:PPE-repeat protein